MNHLEKILENGLDWDTVVSVSIMFLYLLNCFNELVKILFALHLMFV